MKALFIVAGSGLLVAASAAGLLVVLPGGRGIETVPQVDSLVSASIPRLGAETAAPAPPAHFSVSNLGARTVCLVERGGAFTSRSRSFTAPPDCEAVWPGLSGASHWTENDDGTVTLTAVNGAAVLTLVRGRGFSYEAEMAGKDHIAWLMLP